MKDIVKQVQTIKVKTLLFAIFGLWLLSVLYTFAFVETYHFHNLSDKNIKTQKQCLDHFLSVFKTHKIPLILFDIDILPELFQARPKSWHDSDHKCKTLCKYHPEDKNVITFAIQGSKIEGKEGKVMNELEDLGYALHLSMVADPRLLATDGTVSLIPSYLWVAKDDHVIHVAFMHERIGSYVWIAPVADSDWKDTVDVLAPALTDGWHSMERIGAKFPTYAQAFDKSQRFLGLPLEIDGHKVNVPYHIKAFLKEYENSHFIDCDHDRARKYKAEHEVNLTPADIDFKMNAKKVLLKAKAVLDGLEIPFWLSSGTCLGWFRQCDIIPYSVDVDIGIFIHDHSLKIIEEMHDAGLTLIHKFGKTRDSLEYSFIGDDGIKLDIFFFYELHDHIWNGGTQAHDGRKYKYTFPKFKLCWTEFLDVKIRVPCNPEKYIEANYGKDWMLPVKNWQWNLHPPNVQTNGKWDESEWDVAIQIYEPTDEHRKRIDELRQKVKEMEDFPSDLELQLDRFEQARLKEGKYTGFYGDHYEDEQKEDTAQEYALNADDKESADEIVMDEHAVGPDTAKLESDDSDSLPKGPDELPNVKQDIKTDEGVSEKAEQVPAHDDH